MATASSARTAPWPEREPRYITSNAEHMPSAMPILGRRIEQHEEYIQKYEIIRKQQRKDADSIAKAKFIVRSHKSIADVAIEPARILVDEKRRFLADEARIAQSKQDARSAAFYKHKTQQYYYLVLCDRVALLPKELRYMIYGYLVPDARARGMPCNECDEDNDEAHYKKIDRLPYNWRYNPWNEGPAQIWRYKHVASIHRELVEAWYSRLVFNIGFCHFPRVIAMADPWGYDSNKVGLIRNWSLYITQLNVADPYMVGNGAVWLRRAFRDWVAAGASKNEEISIYLVPYKSIWIPSLPELAEFWWDFRDLWEVLEGLRREGYGKIEVTTGSLYEITARGDKISGTRWWRKMKEARDEMLVLS